MIRVTTREVRSALTDMFATTSVIGQEHAFGLGPVLEEPVVLDGVSYSIRMGGLLTRSVPGTDTPIAFTFTLVTPPQEIKKGFAAEMSKPGAPLNEIIGSYYAPLALAKFDALAEGQNEGINDFYASEGLPERFAFHVVCLTADFDFALVFIEEASLMRVIGEG
jgi:hypothetical protein